MPVKPFVPGSNSANRAMETPLTIMESALNATEPHGRCPDVGGVAAGAQSFSPIGLSAVPNRPSLRAFTNA